MSDEEDRPDEESESTSDGSEQPEQAVEQPEETADPKSVTSDPRNARKLSQDNRAQEKALAALLGERGPIGNVIVANTIGLVDSGAQSRGPSYGSVPSGPIAPEVIEAVTATFVQPSCYHELRRKLRERSVVLLRCPAGWGRTAAALHLLGRECADGVDKLNPDTSMRGPSAALGLRANRGYLLESLEADQAAALTEFSLDVWRTALATAQAKMIVLVDAATPVRDRDLADYLVETDERPDALALVRAHFRARLAAAGKPDQELADFPEFAPLVEEVVATARRAQDLADFGRGLCRAVLGECDLDDVRRGFASSADGAFREWFDGLGDNDHRAFAIALGAFDGMPLHTVTDAATQLARAMQAAELPDRRDRKREVFGVRNISLVERAEAETAASVEDTDYGSLTVQVVRYRDPRRPRKVLEHVWHEFPEAQQVVRTWLRRLGTSPDRQVRARAGVAAGLLSLTEFDRARLQVIEPWVDDHGEWGRQAAIAALRVPVLQPELQPLISRMITQWLEGEEVTDFHVAAVTALGALPIMTADRALKLLRKAADTDSARMIIALAGAVTNLALDADRLPVVLGELMRWTGSETLDVRGCGFHCVVQLCTFLEVSEEGSSRPWPGLLWIADLDRREPGRTLVRNKITQRAAIVELLARTIEAPHFMQDMYDLLRRWTRIADRDATQREALGLLLVELGRATGDTASLREHLTAWADERRGPAAAVPDLLAVMDREENRP